MKIVYVTRDKYGFKYKTEPLSDWSYLPDRVTDQKTLQNYFTDDGRRDPVQVVFTDSYGKPASIIEVTRKESKVECIVNAGEGRFQLFCFDFLDNKEAIQFFRERSSDEVNAVADKLQNSIPTERFRNELETIKYYRENADQETLTSYKSLIAERMSDDAIRNRLQDYDNGKSEIFIK